MTKHCRGDFTPRVSVIKKNWSSSNWTLPTLPSTSGKDPTSTRRLRSTTYGDDGFYATKGRVHRLGPRKYLCRDCGDTFTLKASLTRHQALECRDQMLAKKAMKVKAMMGVKTLKSGVRGRPRTIRPKMKTTMPLKTIKTIPAKSTTVVNLASLKSMPIEELQQYLKPDPDGPPDAKQGILAFGTKPGDQPPKKKKKHTCKRCGRIYAFYTSLWRHLHYECGMEPKFSCEACPLRFAQKSNLERHFKNMHTPHPHNITI
ncbi:Similar to lola: Longitudinals lacking protein [Cotesia congregata]|uniref:Isoforms A/B/D/L (Drosophila melanogaster) n=2 Tax=Cotesia TaxID=32390 RepID=A0A8J2HFI5_COTCN|nr:Similar to lola: Longitudinals lacking protein [Cotesia congregata]